MVRRVGTNGDLSYTVRVQLNVSPVSGSTNPAVPFPSVLLAACMRAVGVGPSPLSLSLREDGPGGLDAKLF